MNIFSQMSNGLFSKKLEANCERERAGRGCLPCWWVQGRTGGQAGFPAAPVPGFLVRVRDGRPCQQEIMRKDVQRRGFVLSA